jgi:hypothetical protein
MQYEGSGVTSMSQHRRAGCLGQVASFKER